MDYTDRHLSVSDYLDKLHQVSSFTNTTTIYNSNYDELSVREFNSKMSNVSNFIILIITKNNDVFGLYQQDSIIVPRRLNRVMQITTRNKFVLFSLSSMSEFTIIERVKENDKTLLMQSETSSMLLSCYSAFWITTDGSIRLHPLITNNYIINKDTDLLPNKVNSHTLQSLYCFALD